MEVKTKFFKSLGAKLVLSVGLILVISIAVFAVVNTKDQRDQLINQVITGANQFSDTVMSSTWYYMLKVERDDIHRIIDSIGDQEEIDDLRIFNKEGVIMFSSIEDERGHKVNLQAEACYACHAREKPLERLSTPERTRIYRKPDGERVLGMITAIYNEPACYNAACHAHPKNKQVLGILDIVMSLTDVDKKIAGSRKKIWLFASMEMLVISFIIVAFLHTSVVKPIGRLVSGTQKIASGDLTTRVKIKSADEFGVLSDSFNQMAKNLQRAEQELTEWGKTLEHKVEERTKELKQTQAQLVQSEKMASLGKLSAGVAHELNNPLTGVLTYASLLYEDSQEGSPEKEDLKVIIDETSRCKRIIRDLLEFSHQNQPMKNRININSLIQNTLSVLKYQAAFQDIEIIKEFDENLPDVEADRDQIQQVFMNIIMNAADSMPHGGSLTIETRLSSVADNVKITFTDTGKGIEEEHIPKLFDPFFTTKPVGQGTGLGLAVSYGIIRRHHGSINVKSALGKGATFTITLPTISGTEEDEHDEYYEEEPENEEVQIKDEEK